MKYFDIKKTNFLMTKYNPCINVYRVRPNNGNTHIIIVLVKKMSNLNFFGYANSHIYT